MFLSTLIFNIALAAFPPCPYEDSPNCSWNASTAGLANGGNSFVDIGGTAYYRQDFTAKAATFRFLRAVTPKCKKSSTTNCHYSDSVSYTTPAGVIWAEKHHGKYSVDFYPDAEVVKYKAGKVLYRGDTEVRTAPAR